ncbi:unnamed protein product [Dovyalis caffra]|uniref:Uncharacterized protein n=1 Tax=Dovyalis caffra TaxID=77055 RepID=A0AAV1RNP8_9ROSI|nr:unnamed protein product [Dovyalis caffra]
MLEPAESTQLRIASSFFKSKVKRKPTLALPVHRKASESGRKTEFLYQLANFLSAD